MGIRNTAAYVAAERRGSIKDADVLRLRRSVIEACQIGADDAAALLDLHANCSAQEPTWASFLVEMVSEHIISEAEPRGYLTVANAQWLTDRISADGVIATRAEFALLVATIERARWVPESLVELSLDQVCRAVQSGESPLRDGEGRPPGRITDAEIADVFRVLCAASADGGAALTPREMASLAAVDGGVAEIDRPVSWVLLFNAALASVVLAASGYQAATRAQALAPARSGRPFEDLAAIYDAEAPQDGMLRDLERQRRSIVTHEEVSSDHASWLARRFTAAGAARPRDAALIQVLREAGFSLHSCCDMPDAAPCAETLRQLRGDGRDILRGRSRPDRREDTHAPADAVEMVKPATSPGLADEVGDGIAHENRLA
jgi:hypothetical protein